MQRGVCVVTLLAVAFCCFAAAQVTTVTPPASGAYLNNGMGGLYKWLGWNIAPLPSRDAYDRFSWRQLEPTMNNYDFSRIDALLADAKRNGGKAGFRVMISDSYVGGKGAPAYFATNANGWTCGALKNTWIPHWDNPALLTRMTALFTALANRYANDARLGFVDVGIYGNYAEWHNAEFYQAGCFPGPNGWGEASWARKKAFIDLVANKFPKKYIALNTNDRDGLCYALSTTRIGLRGDTLSDASWRSKATSGDQLYELMRRQYRVAPFISEFSTNADFTKFKGQILEEHRTNVGNGNFPVWSSVPAAQRSAFLDAVRFLGARLRVTKASWTSTVPRGGCLEVSLTLVNDGSSRVYDPYNTVIQLRQGASVKWSTSSVVDIRNVMPKNDGMSSYSATNRFVVPQTLAAGTYSVVLAVRDPTGYRPNYLLAIASPNADNTFTLGTLVLSSTVLSTPPATCTTTRPAYTQKKYLIGKGVNSWNDHPLMPLFTDRLMWGWSQELNGATGNVASTSPVWGGTHAIAFTTTRAWGIWAIRHVCSGINVAGYKYLHFRMRAASATSGRVFVYPYKAPWNNPPSANLAGHGGDPVHTAWRNYNIPLTAFPGLPNTITHLVFGGFSSGATFYIDDIAFSDNIVK